MEGWLNDYFHHPFKTSRADQYRVTACVQTVRVPKASYTSRTTINLDRQVGEGSEPINRLLAANCGPPFTFPAQSILEGY
jgi:hypothetical protein